MFKTEILKILENFYYMVVDLSEMQNNVEVLVIMTYILYSAM